MAFFCVQRQLYLVAFIYDDIAQFYVAWTSQYMLYSNGRMYVFNGPGIEQQL